MDGVSVSEIAVATSRSRCVRDSLLAPSGACTPYIGTTYKSFVRQARENPDPNIRYIAYAKLGSPSIYEDQAQKDEAVKILIAKLDEGKSRWRSARPSSEAWATWAIAVLARESSRQSTISTTR